MLILICKVIGFFQGILKGKKSEFNYHYSKKHHGTECLRPSHVCFTPLSKMQAGRGGRGGDAAGTRRRCLAAPRTRCQARPWLPAESEGLGPCVTPAAAGPEGSSTTDTRRPARDMWHRVPQRGSGRTRARGNHVSTGRARFWKGFLSLSRFVFTKMDFQQ